MNKKVIGTIAHIDHSKTALTAVVTRYLINYDGRGETVHPSGDFVHYEDCARLQEQVEALRAERERLRAVLQALAADIYAIPDTNVQDMVLAALQKESQP